MGKILLAVEGIQPKPEVINYALDLSQDLGAELDILEIVPGSVQSKRIQGNTSPGKSNPPVFNNSLCKKNNYLLVPAYAQKSIKKIKQGLKIVQTILEESMCAASFAEAGEDRIARQIIEQALHNLSPYLNRQKAKKLYPHLYLKQGALAEEIIKFVRTKKKIIFTIFNPQKTANSTIKILQKELPVPLVLVSPRKD